MEKLNREIPNRVPKDKEINRMIRKVENDISNLDENQKRTFLIDIVQMTRRLRKEIWDELEEKNKRRLMSMNLENSMNDFESNSQ